MMIVLCASDRIDCILLKKRKKKMKVFPAEPKILGRADKATGKFKNWHNLQFIYTDGRHGQKEAVDLSRVDKCHYGI